MSIDEIHAAGFPVTAADHDRLSRFLSRLLDENHRINLTAIRSTELAWPLHILDSLAIWPFFDRLSVKRVVDLGTGGGVPGIPLACVAPHVHFLLVDATRKKIEAVRRIVEPLGLSNVELVWGRAETLGRSAAHCGSADFVIARAVAKLSELTVLAAPFLRGGGLCGFMKSTIDLEREIADAELSAAKAGLTLVETHRYSLTSPHGKRAIVVFRRQ